MAVIDARVIILGGGTAPGHHDLVGVTFLAIDEAGIGVDGSGVGDPHGVIAVAGEQLAVDIA